MRNKPFVRLCAYRMVLILTLTVSGISGCGIKGSPVPPVYAKPPAASELQYRVDGSQLTITWSVPTKTSDTPAIAGAKVFRLKQSLKNEPCQDCPRIFTLMRKIPASSGTMQFQDTIDNGFEYYYKIILYDAGNHDGEDADIVHVRTK